MRVTKPQLSELLRHADAYLSGFVVVGRDPMFTKLVDLGLIDDGNTILTKEGWKIIIPHLSPDDAETAGYLASGNFRLRFSESWESRLSKYSGDCRS